MSNDFVYRFANEGDTDQIAAVKHACFNTDSLKEARVSIVEEMEKGYQFFVAEHHRGGYCRHLCLADAWQTKAWAC